LQGVLITDIFQVRKKERKRKLLRRHGCYCASVATLKDALPPASLHKVAVGLRVRMCVTKLKSTCSLVLEDGTILPGESFGAKIPVDGEVGESFSCSIAFVFEKILRAFGR
jgi:hypothetical protein